MANKYFDYSATSITNSKVVKKILKSYKPEILFANPSSLNVNAIIAKELLENARKEIAAILGCKQNEVIFTSGGTESDNIAIKGIMLKYKPEQAEMITTEIEHPAVLNVCKELEELGYKIHYVKPDKKGYIYPVQIKNLINENTKLISVMAVNNEIGKILPVNEIAGIANQYNIPFHCDAVQSVGLTKINIADMSLVSYSAHKFGGLKGTGILIKKENLELYNIIRGGGQEFNIRSGTENLFGVLVMKECLKQTLENWKKNRNRIQGLILNIWDQLDIRYHSDIMLNGTLIKRAPNNLNIAFRNVDSSVLTYLLAQKGFSVSQGSACHTGETEVSHVLKALDTPQDFINGAIRITLPYNCSKKDINVLVKAIIENVDYLREDSKTLTEKDIKI